MQIVTAFCHKDQALAVRLFRWIFELDGELPQHKCLLVASKGMSEEAINEVFHAAKKVFPETKVISPRTPNEKGWPESCNHLFRTACEFIAATLKTPFFWMEPDCVLLKAGGFDAIEKEYQVSGKLYLGALFASPMPHITGCAVYPADVRKANPECLVSVLDRTGKPVPWDVIAAERVLRQSHQTRLIQHEWGTTAEPPNFPDDISLHRLAPEAVLFHRCKDGSLIERLREQKESQCGFIDRVKRLFNQNCAVMVYLPPPSVADSSVFLKNIAEHPPSLPLLMLSDHPYHNCRPIPDPSAAAVGTDKNGRKNEIANIIFLSAMQIAKRRGLEKVVWLETDCRVSGDGWDTKLISDLRGQDVAAGHLAVVCPDSGDKEFSRELNSARRAYNGHGSHIMLHYDYKIGMPVPFVNGAPAVYRVDEVLKLFPEADGCQNNMLVYDRDIGERISRTEGSLVALRRHAHCPVVLATGEGSLTLPQMSRFCERRPVALVHPVKFNWRPPPPKGYSFHHSGDLGDIIYGLMAMKLIGGGKLFLSPDYRSKWPIHSPMQKPAYDFMQPLLALQPYLKSVEYSATMPDVSYDLNHFRPMIQECKTLAAAQCKLLGVDSIMLKGPWMSCGVKKVAKVVIHRSMRYQAPDFPWPDVLERFKGEIVFVGLPMEHMRFVNQFSQVPFHRAKDALDLAEVINGADWFVGNQSLPCAIAIGLGKKVFQETFDTQADCLFNRATFFNQHQPPKAFETCTS